MSPGVVHVRADICRDCPTPCALQLDANAHADPCASCPATPMRWGLWDCGAPLAPGDRLAAQIEARLLSPVEQALPGAAPLLEAVRRCGGCTQARHALGSNQQHPDAGSVI